MKTTLHDWLFRITLVAIFAGVIASFTAPAPSRSTTHTATNTPITTADTTE